MLLFLLLRRHRLAHLGDFPLHADGIARHELAEYLPEEIKLLPCGLQGGGVRGVRVGFHGSSVKCFTFIINAFVSSFNPDIVLPPGGCFYHEDGAGRPLSKSWTL